MIQQESGGESLLREENNEDRDSDRIRNAVRHGRIVRLKAAMHQPDETVGAAATSA